MAKGELLRIVYNDSNVTYFTSSGPIYRKFVKDRKGEEYVEYRDAQEKLLGTAQEIGFPDGSRRVQFLDRYFIMKWPSRSWPTACWARNLSPSTVPMTE